MDATLCRTCGKRHWGMCDLAMEKFGKLTTPGIRSTQYTQAVSGFAPAGQCPYCDAMRMKNQARAKKHRSK